MKRTLCLSLATLLATALPSQAQIQRSEYEARRAAVAEEMQDGILVAFGAVNPVAPAALFNQLPAFNYLTGHAEPDAALVLVRRGGTLTQTIFTPEVGVMTQLFDGFRETPADMARRTGFRPRPLSGLRAYVDSLVGTGLTTVYTLRDFRSGDYANADSLTRGGAFIEALTERHPNVQVQNLHPVLNAMRAEKSPAEIALIRRAVDITDEAHREVLRTIRPGMHEYEIQALVEYVFRRNGADGPSFGSIIASGPNSTILHYVANERQMEDGDVVVMDIGAQYDGYAADITRTIPVNGRFTPEQRAVYEIVLEAQKAAEQEVKPGVSFGVANEASARVRRQGLARLGLIESEDATFDPPWNANCTATSQACRQAQLFMIHGISHGIGLEVHDPAQFYTSPNTFGEGDVFTIEPGIYISSRVLDLLPDTPKNRAFLAKVRPVVERYDNIGVRIEDDYIVTATGVDRISRAPREITEIEQAMQAAQ